MTQYITIDDLPIINAALEKGEIVRIRHTKKGGTKITKEMTNLLKVKRVEEQIRK